MELLACFHHTTFLIILVKLVLSTLRLVIHYIVHIELYVSLFFSFLLATYIHPFYTNKLCVKTWYLLKHLVFYHFYYKYYYANGILCHNSFSTSFHSLTKTPNTIICFHSKSHTQIKYNKKRGSIQTPTL